MKALWQLWSDARLRTVLLVNLAAVMERLDEQTLPSLYSAVSASLQASPAQLGYLTLCRALVQALASPFGGIAGEPEQVSSAASRQLAIPVCLHACHCGSLYLILQMFQRLTPSVLVNLPVASGITCPCSRPARLLRWQSEVQAQPQLLTVLQGTYTIASG